MPVGNKIREKLRKLKLGSGFPSEIVMKVSNSEGKPVDDSREEFVDWLWASQKVNRLIVGGKDG